MKQFDNFQWIKIIYLMEMHRIADKNNIMLEQPVTSELIEEEELENRCSKVK